jgi:hypothetical protein
MADLSSKVFHDTLLAWESEANIIVNEGGTRSGKTYSVLQLLALIAWRSPEPLLISVVTQTFPQLRQGAMRDFEKVVAELPITYTENKSTHTWEIGRGKVEFFSVDTDENDEIAAEYGIVSIPTLVILKNGKEVARDTGFKPEPVLRAFIDANT